MSILLPLHHLLARAARSLSAWVIGLGLLAAGALFLQLVPLGLGTQERQLTGMLEQLSWLVGIVAATASLAELDRNRWWWTRLGTRQAAGGQIVALAGALLAGNLLFAVPLGLAAHWMGLELDSFRLPALLASLLHTLALALVCLWTPGLRRLLPWNLPLLAWVLPALLGPFGAPLNASACLAADSEMRDCFAALGWSIVLLSVLWLVLHCFVPRRST